MWANLDENNYPVNDYNVINVYNVLIATVVWLLPGVKVRSAEMATCFFPAGRHGTINRQHVAASRRKCLSYYLLLCHSNVSKAYLKVVGPKLGGSPLILGGPQMIMLFFPHSTVNNRTYKTSKTLWGERRPSRSGGGRVSRLYVLSSVSLGHMGRAEPGLNRVCLLASVWSSAH